MKRKIGVFDVINGLIMAFIAVITLYPFLNVLAISLNDAMDTLKGGIYIFPRVFTFRNYQEVFKNKSLLIATRTSVLRTIIGTILGIISTTMVAYVISRSDFFLHKIISRMFAVTLYISGGMIPSYLLFRKLGLINTFWVYVIPSIIGVYYIYIVRSFIDGLPHALQESAQIDGANDWVIFWKIIFPLCKPVVATIALYYAVGQWNSWFDTYMYASRAKNLTTLQYELMKILTAASAQTTNAVQQNKVLKPGSTVSPESMRMAITMVATLPILIVYPFLQKYFVQGMTLGAVKD